MSASCMASDLPAVPPPVRCEQPWPPSPGAINIPPTFEAAVGQILVCLSADDHDVIRKETEVQHSARTHMALGLAIRNEWLRPNGSPLQQELRKMGFEYPDDMSGAILSGVWHRVHEQPMDPIAMATCVRAWNSEMRRLISSVPAGAQIPSPGFACADDQAIQAGRKTWETIGR